MAVKKALINYKFYLIKKYESIKPYKIKWEICKIDRIL